ncbi:MAG: hypothetical protein JEZ06_04410 [Anaerolineaceae bacterium]|nr:hypothetical protein [Anaerolineaceae bacterium]
MSLYTLPKICEPESIGEKEIILVSSGDLRISANQTCWPAQEEMEDCLESVFAAEGYSIIRGHSFDPVEQHGFISTQAMGIEIFRKIPKDARLIVAEAVWQYSYHVLAGLRDHQGPILTVANWSGQWPGLVGLLNLNASLTKMGVAYSTIWSKDFSDDYFIHAIRQWLKEDQITHDASHVRELDVQSLSQPERELGIALAKQLKCEKAIMGIFDEGCMGMYNAIFDDELLNVMGIYKERLSQSALVAAMRLVSDEEALMTYEWLNQKGMQFEIGEDEATELTNWQVLEQMKMYIAAVRIANDYGCACIGIQYQQGLKDMAPASDLVEGLLNNVERPPVFHRETREELFPGEALVHFNEVDEGAGVDALVTNRIWKAMGFDPATTLHDIRYGEYYKDSKVDAFVWVFLISGSVPPSHLIDEYQGSVSKRQDAMFFPLGGGTLAGISKPGEIVWSRVFEMGGCLHADLGRATVVELPEEETSRRLKETTAVWPIMHAVLHGVSRDQMMGRHKSNHLNVAYTPSSEDADRALSAKAAMFHEMGIQVHLCGDVKI